MRGWRLIAGIALLLVIGAAVGGWMMRGRLAELAMARLYDRAMGGDPLAELPDGLHVGLCGAGSPMPDPHRGGPCVAVIAGDRFFVVDSGGGSSRTLAQMNLPLRDLDAVFLTHFHSDHIDGLGELMLQRWANASAAAPLPVYGPTGVDEVVNGFEAAYRLDRGYRIAHHGEQIVPSSGFGGDPRPFAVSADRPNVLLINEGGLQVIAFPVAHDPVEPAVGYLFIYKGRRLVVSGDTAPSPRLEAAARGADVLAHEGLSPNLVAIQRQAALRAGRRNTAQILADIGPYHSAPEAVAGIAQRAGVRYLLFEHIIPPLPTSALEGPFLGRSRQIFRGPIHVGRDGDFISLPAGSNEIRRTNRLSLLR